LTCAVSVITNYNLIGIAFHKDCLLICKSSAECCDRIRKTRLIKRNNIHISLAQNQRACTRAFGIVKRKQVFALFKHRSIGSIEILRLFVGHNSAAESYNISAQIYNRKHYSVYKAVINSVTVFSFESKVCGVNFIFRKAFVFQMITKRVPIVIGKAESEMPYRTVR